MGQLESNASPRFQRYRTLEEIVWNIEEDDAYLRITPVGMLLVYGKDGEIKEAQSTAAVPHRIRICVEVEDA